MKLVKRISLFIVFGAFFAAGAYAGICGQNFFYPGFEPRHNTGYYQGREVMKSSDYYIDSDTVYHIAEVDQSGHMLQEAFLHVPSQYIGLTLTQLNQIIENYNSSPGLSEIRKGFLDMKVEQFSPEELYVVKTYQKKNTAYVLGIRDHEVVVYEEDGITIYLNTDIRATDLPEDILQELLQTKKVENEEELYDFLESYSS